MCAASLAEVVLVSELHNHVHFDHYSDNYTITGTTWLVDWGATMGWLFPIHIWFRELFYADNQIQFKVVPCAILLFMLNLFKRPIEPTAADASSKMAT